MPCGTMLVYLGNLLVFLYLVNLSTKKLVVSNAMRGEKTQGEYFPERDKVHSPMASD